MRAIGFDAFGRSPNAGVMAGIAASTQKNAGATNQCS